MFKDGYMCAHYSLDILLFPVDRDTHNFFAAFRIMFLMPQVCFKPSSWCNEMHHLMTVFLCGIMTFSYCVMFIHIKFIFKRKAYRAFCLKKSLRICPDHIYLELINIGHADSCMAKKNHGKLSSWRLTCEWTLHNTKKLWCHTRKMSSQGAFQCTIWSVWNKLAASKLWRRQKHLWGSQSTGKCNKYLSDFDLC